MLHPSETRFFKDATVVRDYTDALTKYALSRLARNPRVRNQLKGQVRSAMYSNKSDLDIIKTILGKVAPHELVRGASSARVDNRTDALENLLAAAGATQPAHVIDYGCGDGAITRAMTDKWGCEILGVDTHAERPVEFDPIALDSMELVRAEIKYANDISSIADESQDLVTAFMSLHHMHGVLNQVLAEIRRVLKPGAHLIIREHDLIEGPRRVAMHSFLQLVHMLYDTRDGKLNMHQLLEETKYYARAEWDEILNTAGFALVKYLPGAAERNPQGIYHSIYVRK